MRTRRVSAFALSCAAFIAAAACGNQARGNTNTSGGANTIAVSNIDLGRAINADLTIKDKTTTFRPADMVYASVETKGAAPATVGVRWVYQDSTVVEDGTFIRRARRAPNSISPSRTDSRRGTTGSK